MFRRITITYVLIVLLVAAISGCGSSVQVQSDLTPKQSIELLVLFDQAGINAHRELASSGRGQRYTVFVPKASFKKALLVMYELKLPKQTQDDLNALTKSDGFFPVSQQMATLRYDIARAFLVERQLETLSGILDAKVTINSPVSNLNRASSASVVVRYVDSGQPVPVARIRDIMVQGIEGLSVDDIIIETVPITSIVFSSLKSGINKSNPELAKLDSEPFWPFQFRVYKGDSTVAFSQLTYAVLFIFVGGCAVGLLIGFLFLNKQGRSNKVIHNDVNNDNLKSKQKTVLSTTQQQSAKRPLRQPTLMLSAKEARDIGGGIDID